MVEANYSTGKASLLGYDHLCLWFLHHRHRFHVQKPRIMDGKLQDSQVHDL